MVKGFTDTDIPKIMQRAIRVMPQEIERQMDVIADEWESQAAGIVLREGHVFKHRLRNDIECRSFTAEDVIGVIGFVPSTNQHGVVIHEGRKSPAKAPPFDALSEWVAKKLGIPEDDESHWIITRTIQRNIARNGFKSLPAGGLRYFDRPLLANLNEWKKQVVDNTQKAMRKAGV